MCLLRKKLVFAKPQLLSAAHFHGADDFYIDLLVVLDSNTGLIAAFRGVKVFAVVNCLENVFADLNPQINAAGPEGKKEKPKRNAFVFITAEPDSGKNAFEDLKKVEGVNEVYLSHGDYDFIVKVSGESLDHLREIVFKLTKNLSSIKSTLTLMVI